MGSSGKEILCVEAGMSMGRGLLTLQCPSRMTRWGPRPPATRKVLSPEHKPCSLCEYKVLGVGAQVKHSRNSECGGTRKHFGNHVDISLATAPVTKILAFMFTVITKGGEYF